MSVEQQRQPCDSECGAIRTERNRYFTGKYMTARDFEDEQAYFLSRRRLHNRLLHGWGIACGLGVTPHPDPQCKDHWVVVHPGIALDCCGREILLQDAVAFAVPRPKAGDKTAIDDYKRPFLLCVAYDETPIEQVPALYAEGVCDPTRCEANRVREIASLKIVYLDDAAVKSDCWLHPADERDERYVLPYRDDCAEGAPGPAGTCLTPACPCGDYVPLALIRPQVSDTDVTGYSLDLRGRRTLPVPPEYLTHIVDFNWPHGGEVTLDQLRTVMEGRLTITFDRKILPTDGDRTGINDFTFLAQYGDVQSSLEFLPTDEKNPLTLESDRIAVFTLDSNAMLGKGRSNIVGSVIYITLKCDFILDCHDNPVDGTHLRGRVPTGNGVPGGDFCSWFRVVDK